MSQRIIQPRQKSSSRMGTRMAEEKERKSMKGMLAFRLGSRELAAAPVREF
jgi:hypothetical protein